MSEVSKINTKTYNKKQLMLNCLEKHLGVVTMAAKEAGIERCTHYEWMNNDPEYKAAVDAMKELVIDFAEHHLHKRISEGSDSSLIFFLKCQAKSRGYIEKQQIELSGEITENKVIKGVSIEQAAEILADEDE